MGLRLIRRFRRALLVALIAGSFGLTAEGLRAEISRLPDLPTLGVKHALIASLTLSPGQASGGAEPDKPTELEGNVQVSVRISDHAPGTRFYATLVSSFVRIGADRPGPSQTIWEDRLCHPDRGLPKVTVVKIEGSIRNGDRKLDIAALPRLIGKLIPMDEIVVTKRPETRPGEWAGKFLFRAATGLSRLMVDLELTTQRCKI